jgi:hypothetical protein
MFVPLIIENSATERAEREGNADSRLAGCKGEAERKKRKEWRVSSFC